MNHVIKFYESFDEDSRLQTRKSKRIEFITTTKILDSYFKQPTNILEVGAGSGVYSFYFAQHGHTVTATDLSEKHIAVMHEKSKHSDRFPIQMFEADATDLHMLADNSFDAVLCLGPMYHLVDLDMQKRCISECLRVLKPEGIVAFAYIPRHQVFPYVVQGDRKYFTDEWLDRILSRGSTRAAEQDSFWTDAYYHTPEQIEQLLIEHQMEIVDHIATDGIAPLMGEFIDQLDDEEYEVWLQYHFRTCREPSILGMSNHGLVIGKK